MYTGEDIPEEVDMEVQGDGEELEVGGKLKRGRAKSTGRRSLVEILQEGLTSPEPTRRRTSSPSTPASTMRVDTRTSGTAPKQKDASATSARPSFYVLGKAPTSFNMSKLPKSAPVLGRLLMLLGTHSLAEAQRMLGDEVKAV